MSKQLINVEMPDGTIIEGVPEGVTQGEVMRRYAKMKGAAEAPGILAAQAAKFPSSQEQGRGGAGRDAQPGILQQAMKHVQDFTTGIDKAGGSFIQAGGDWVANSLGMKVPPPRMTPTGRDVFAPDNTAQSVGNVAGQIGLGVGAGIAGGPTLAGGVAAGGLSGALQNPDAPEIPAALGMAAPIVTTAASAAYRALKAGDPITDYVRALKPGKNMPDFSTRTAPAALDELKAYEDAFGVKVKTAAQAREAFKVRSKVYNDVADKILEPRVDVMVPGSGAKIAQAKIEAIPDSVRLLDPEKYKSLVRSARQSAGDDFTIGQLNNIRKGQNAKAAASYGKNVKAMVIADENIAAMERAAADTSREILYESTNQASPMAGSAFKEANRRLGAIIENQDLVEGKINSAIAQNRSMPKKAVETLGKIASPGTSLKEWARGESKSINENLASAVKRWQGRPATIPTHFGAVERRLGQFSSPSGVAPNLRDASPLRQPVPPQFSVPSGSGPGGPLPDVPVQPPPVDYLRGR